MRLSKIPQFVDYSRTHHVIRIKNVKERNDTAFTFLLDSGNHYLKNNDYDAAYYEFKLAYKIKKEDKDLRQIMIETLIVLCKEENEYCSDLDDLMSKL